MSMKRVLFVDDEPRVLSGLRRMLRSTQSTWEMTFANSGAEGLEILDRTSYDVIVSDLRMPSMDGAELLRRVAQQHPNTVRIVLSGQPEMEHFLKTVGPAHQYLSKPCGADLLKSTVNRASAVQRMLMAPALLEIVSGMESLPSRSAVVQELLGELMSPDCTVRTVSGIVSRDMGLTTRVMRVVNSAYFGLPKAVSDPTKAVSLLGLDAIRSLVLSLQLFTAFGEAADSGLSLDGLWTHCSAVGACARKLARSQGFGPVEVGHALLAGLLHDMGKLVIADQFPEAYGELLARAEREGKPLCQLELEAFGADHAVVGGYLAGLWGFPHPVVEALLYHHSPAEGFSEGPDTLALVHLANALEHEVRECPEVSVADRDYLERLGLGETFEEWLEAARDEGEEA
jgi:putative nucleotidyltransferase with HDIG domain